MNSAVDLGLAVAGAALVGGAAAWRITARKGARATLKTALNSPNPDSRIAALHIVASEGVAAYADMLKQRAAVESNPQVRRTLAEVIARSQWEPAGDQALVELRLWAHRLLNNPSAATPLAQVSYPKSAPESADVLAPTDDNTAVDARAEPPFEQVLSEPMAPVIDEIPAMLPFRRAEPEWWTRAPIDPRPTVVLVTGAGGPAGTAVIRWLRASGHRVVAADADPSAVGLRLADESAIVCRYDDPDYVGGLCETAKATQARVLVPTLAEELLPLAAARDQLSEAGLGFFLPEPDAVLDCIDKWRFAKVTQAAGLSVPTTNLGSADGVPGPWVIKPRRGRGSRDIVMAEDETGLKYGLETVPEPIVQTRVEGREFTADVLVAPSGELAGVVPRWRLETRGGISSKGQTFHDAGLIVDVAQLMDALRLRGPANVQGFFGEDGVTRLVEVNPRFSGGLPLSLAAGADFVGEFVRAARGLPVRSERCRFRPGVTMLRFFEDVFEG